MPTKACSRVAPTVVRHSKEVAVGAGHLLPGTEERFTDALDAMAKAATTAPRRAAVAALR